MKNLTTWSNQLYECRLWCDETGFIVSAELILVSTILVIGIIVGLSEVQHAVNAELNDVGEAIGNLNQSYVYSGFSANKGYGWGGFGFGLKSYTFGSSFFDRGDDCDRNECAISCFGPRSEIPKGGSTGVCGNVSCSGNAFYSSSTIVESPSYESRATVKEYRVLEAPGIDSSCDPSVSPSR